jgi:hypothetical protein
MVDQVTLEGRALPIFPCNWSNKKPTCDHGFKDATTDPAEIDRLWDLRPGKLTGVRTGEASGLAILDVDPRHKGEAWLAEFECTHGFPSTRIHVTRSGGMHFVFRHRRGLDSSRDLIARGVDIRADKGYAIWWPAAGCRVLAEGPIAEWPASLDQAIAEGEARRGRKAAENHARYDAALREERRTNAPYVSQCREGEYREVPKPLYWKLCGLMRDAPRHNLRRVRGILSVVTDKVGTELGGEDEGRNDALYWAACRLQELIAEGMLSLVDAEKLLLGAAHQNGYVAKDGMGDTMATIHSGLGVGVEHLGCICSSSDREVWLSDREVLMLWMR